MPPKTKSGLIRVLPVLLGLSGALPAAGVTMGAISTSSAGIGTHVHKIGHLLGLNHGAGGWVGENPHTSTVAPHARPHTNATGANFVGWGIMQSATEGPELSSNGYHQGYGSCPLPVNPFYRMDLGWIDPPAITEGQQDYVLALGSVHRIAANKSQSLTRAHTDTVLLERRSHHGFGRYVSFYKFADPKVELRVSVALLGGLSEEVRSVLRRKRRDVECDRHDRGDEYQDQFVHIDCLSSRFTVEAHSVASV